MSIISNTLPLLLSQVERPGRYIGHEINIQITPWDTTSCRVCLVYPDTYEVGMPFIGYQILYHIINSKKDFLAERCFSPWVDMEKELRKHNVPLFSLESQHPLNAFDIVGFTLQYEMTYTNILNALDLSHIPIYAAERTNKDPLIFAGGSCAFNPEPLADFIDVFIIGDGEIISPKLCDIVRDCKAHNASRKETLEALNLPAEGVYVPECYHQNIDGPVQAAKIPYLDNSYYPTRPIIPFIEITQDRFALEIQRGCGAGCRFCHAGMIYRPVRERNPEDLIEQAKETLKNTGYEEISLLSLSTSDYSGLNELVNGIKPICDEDNIAISFPSLRLDSFNLEIIKAAGNQRRTSLTFAPEAGTQRLRDVINKRINENDIFSSVNLALENKWRTLKFYFMVGLPTETDEDLQGIVDLILRIQNITRKHPHSRINVTLSTFIPKAHTPFQWAEHVSPEELTRRIYFIRNQLHIPNVKISHREPRFSVYESLLSRGDRAIGKVIYSAWKYGAKFDAWSEMFYQKAWDQALEENDIQIENAIAKWPVDTPLPWAFIHTGVDIEFLKKEKQKAEEGEITKDCRIHCEQCGLCYSDLKNLIARSTPSSAHTIPSAAPKTKEQPQTYYTLRLNFEKKGLMRYISHHDFSRLIQRICNVLHWPVRYTNGYNRRPRIALGYPIPMGYDASNETMDILLNDKIDTPVEKLNAVLPEGICILSANYYSEKRKSIMEITSELYYVFHFQESIDVIEIRQHIERILAQDSWIVERKHKKGIKEIDLKPFIKYWNIDEHSMAVCYKVEDSRTGRPDEFLKLAFGENIPYYIGERKRVTLKE